MNQLHATGHLIVLVLAVGYGLLGLAIASFERVPRHAFFASLVLLIAVVLTAGVGVLNFLLGSGPSELIHWVYGIAMTLGVLASIGSSTSMAPRPRGLVMAATGTFLLLLAFRLSETG